MIPRAYRFLYIISGFIFYKNVVFFEFCLFSFEYDPAYKKWVDFFTFFCYLSNNLYTYFTVRTAASDTTILPSVPVTTQRYF